MPITRQDLAIMLRNFAAKAGLSTTTTINFSAFKDGKNVDSYASSAVAWCVNNKIMNGADRSDGKYLLPKQNATRGECAKMFSLLDDLIK